MKARTRRMGYIGWILGSFAIAAALSYAFPARAHGDAEWIERGAYYIIGSNPRAHCCGIDHCKRLTRDEVMNLGNRFKLGSERLGLYQEWPADKTFASENADYWVCHDGPRIRCFFAPAGG